MNWFLTADAAILIPVVVVLVILLCERLRPAGTVRPAGRARNLGVGFTGTALLTVAGVWLAPLSTWAVNACGGGFFVLPSSGWSLAIGIATYVVAMDLGEYLFHRAQHAIPWLWSMHSLHHSDPHFNVTTTLRHFWLDSWIKSVTIWLAVGVLIKASPVILGVYGILSYYNFVSHADVRLSFGGGSWLFNSPAYHRLHHSAAPEHSHVNYAALLPLFDLLSGVYRRPRPGVYPDTGLITGECPQSLLGSLIWPWRYRIENLMAGTSIGVRRIYAAYSGKVLARTRSSLRARRY